MSESSSPLYRWRTAAGLSQEQAARRIGVARQTWASLEGGTRPLSLEQAVRISLAFGLGLDGVVDLGRWVQSWHPRLQNLQLPPDVTSVA